jgi:epoxyqueuosine reductase
MTLSEQIKDEAKALGFAAVGIARVSDEPVREHRDRLDAWVDRGAHGAMAWMARDLDRRADPRRVLPGCRSIVCVAVNYYTDQQADERPGYGRIARYAWGRDYHDVLMPRLHRLETAIRHVAPEAETRRYVDSGPIMEKAWAQRAGLGWIGKHSNLVSTQFGSWLLLGEVLTTLELDPDAPAEDLCGSCTVCIRACPTDALTDPYVIDARRCISYLTIELPRSGQTVPDDLQSRVGNRIFGCDDCLDVCPYNVNAVPTAEAAFQPGPLALAAPLDVLSAMTDRDFAAAFDGSPVTRARHRGFMENVRLALGNLLGRLRHATPESSGRAATAGPG